MKLNLKDLPLGKSVLQTSYFHKDSFYEVTKSLKEIHIHVKDLELSIDIDNLHPDYVFDFTITACIQTECDRCLTAYPETITFPFHALCHVDTNHHPHQKNDLTRSSHNIGNIYEEDRDDDDETIFLTTMNMPLTELFCEQIILHIPVKKICRPDCKGLCTECGISLNQDTCSCTKKTIESKSPFLVLSKLKH